MESSAIATIGPANIAGRTRLAGVVLARVAAEAATEREIVHDLQPYLRGGPFAGHAKEEISNLAAALMATGHVTRKNGRCTATGPGRTAALAFLRGEEPEALASWPAARDGYLVAVALGLRQISAQARKLAQRPDGLRALIVASAWKLKATSRPSASQLRSQLAIVALERAFGDQIKAGLAGKTALSAKAARLLASQLAKKPKQHATDQRLIAQLAADAVGSTKGDIESLRTGVIRRFLSEELQEPQSTSAAATQATQRETSGAGAVAAEAGVPAVQPATPSISHSVCAAAPVPHMVPGTPAAFIAAVKAAARTTAEGWAGNRKAFVSHVWAAFTQANPGWAIAANQFKSLLAEAHRLGVISLVTADLRNKQNIADVEASAITWKNTTWHYVRVED